MRHFFRVPEPGVRKEDITSPVFSQLRGLYFRLYFKMSRAISFTFPVDPPVSFPAYQRPSVLAVYIPEIIRRIDCFRRGHQERKREPPVVHFFQGGPEQSPHIAPAAVFFSRGDRNDIGGREFLPLHPDHIRIQLEHGADFPVFLYHIDFIVPCLDIIIVIQKGFRVLREDLFPKFSRLPVFRRVKPAQFHPGLPFPPHGHSIRRMPDQRPSRPCSRNSDIFPARRPPGRKSPRLSQ